MGRYNYSARNIITPSSGRLRADEIELGYLTFMELFRPEIINFYAKLQGCTIMEASNVWKKGLVHYNPTLYKIMQHMTTEPECKKYTNVLINLMWAYIVIYSKIPIELREIFSNSWKRQPASIKNIINNILKVQRLSKSVKLSRVEYKYIQSDRFHIINMDKDIV